MPLPDLTSLQFLVLQVLGGVERSGREVRRRLANAGISKSLASFYQLMSRLEDGGLVRGEYHKIEVGGQTVQERRYKVTGAGLKMYNMVREFYTSAPILGRKGEAAHG